MLQGGIDMPDKYFITYEVAPRVHSIEIRYTYKSNNSKFAEDREVLIEAITHKELCQLVQLLADFGFVDLTEEH